MFVRTAKFVSVALLASLFIGLVSVFSQSRRPPSGQGGEKSNKRDVSPDPLPKATPPSESYGDIKDEDEVIAVNTRLVTLPVRVLDRQGRFVGGIKRESFKVFEDNVEQKIEHFSTAAQPFTVALVLDMSYSAKFRAEQIQAAAIAFINQLRFDDQVLVVSFADEVIIHCQPTSDRKEIYRAIRSTRIETGTSLYEAVDITMNSILRLIEGRKAIVLFTDGVDTTSRDSHDKALANLRDAMELDALIYPILYDTFAEVQAMKGGTVINRSGDRTVRTPPISPSGGNFPIPIPVIGTPDDRGTTREEYDYGERYLNELAVRTGGTVFRADTLGNLDRAFTKIASELREYYSLAYYPSEDAPAGKRRRIKVRVDMPNVAVRARESYTVSEPRSN